MKISCRIKSDLSELNSLLDIVQTLKERWSLPKKTIAETGLLLDELITNAIGHGCCSTENPIDITLKKADNKLIIEIIDAGLPFDPTSIELPDTDIPLEKRKCGGLGILLIRKFSDDCHYTRLNNKNILTLHKNLQEERRKKQRPAKSAMETTITKENNTTIFALNGRLDSNSAPNFEQQLQEFLTSPGSHLLFDFHNLDYISSAGLRVVLNTAKAYKEGQYNFMTCAMQEHVQEVFEISGFDSFITIHRSLDDSLSALRKEK